MGRFLRFLTVLAVITHAGACGSSTQSVTGPSTTKCSVTAVAEPSTFAASGGNGSVKVNTNRECQWNASATGSWIQLGNQVSGQGEGRIEFKVTANVDPSERRGSIVVGEGQVSIVQQAAPCTFTVTPRTDSVTPAGERRTITVAASSAQCTWTARSEADWLTIVEGSQGTGSGRVVYDVQATNGPERSARLVIAGQEVTVRQGVGCTVSINPTSQNVAAGGGTGTIAVNTAAGCAWSARSDVPWITIGSGQTGSGAGSVGFSVAASSGPARSGTIQIENLVFTVNQASGCNYSVSPQSHSLASGGGTGSVSVRAASGCTWTASSGASWITIASGGSGSGDGAVNFSVSSTNGPARTGTMTIAGQSVTVAQASGCTYSINPQSQDFPSDGGRGTISVTSGAGCPWSASGSEGWVNIVAGATGSGNGTVEFTIDRSNEGPRNATINVAGRTFTIQQSGGCSYSLSPTSTSIAAAGGAGSVAIETGDRCSWTASSSEAWARITSRTSGSGDEVLQFVVDANPSTSSRTATLTIGGQAFSITQAGACAYSITPSSTQLGIPGGGGSFSLDTGASCSWSAASSDPSWLTISGPASGAGPATINFSATANGGPPRSATISVAGQTFTVNQAGVP